MSRFLAIAVLLVACGPGDDGNDGFATTSESVSTTGSCDVVETYTVMLDETVGEPGSQFTPQNALDELTGSTNTTSVLTWPDGLTMSLEVEFFYSGGSLTWYDRETNGVLSQEEIRNCYDAVEMEGDFTFVSGDGTFDEAFSGTLNATWREDSRFLVEFGQDELGGNWTPDLSGLDAGLTGATMRFDGGIDAVGSTGEIYAIDGDTVNPVATWSPPPTQG